MLSVPADAPPHGVTVQRLGADGATVAGGACGGQVCNAP